MNKKIIIMIEIAACVIAIVVISVFGNNPETWKDFQYCKSIQFSVKSIELENNTRTYQLVWHVGPSNATITEVIFLSDPNIVDIDNKGLVTFKIFESVRIIVMTTDGSELKDSIEIKFKAPSNGEIEL